MYESSRILYAGSPSLRVQMEQSLHLNARLLLVKDTVFLHQGWPERIIETRSRRSCRGCQFNLDAIVLA
jgi:hypothetical protein